MRKMLLLSAAFCALALSGCAGTQSGVADLVTFTDTDLDNAEALAVQNNDVLAIPCYPAIKTWVHSLPGVSGQVTISGVASGFEAGRVVVNGVGVGIPIEVKQACGGLYMDAHGHLLRLGIGAGLLH